jgi:polyisoprenoid-binding protein YceI
MRYFLAMILALWAGATTAAQVPYRLEPEKSSVGFETDFGGDLITGEMPVTQADLLIDLARVSNSRVSVTLGIAAATASFPFAAQAMKGPRVLAAATYPEISFISTAVHKDGDGALIDGLMTIRGHTEPVTLQAAFYTQHGFELGDLSHLSIVLTGSVLRSHFGATGWDDMVGDEVRLRIVARIAKAG